MAAKKEDNDLIVGIDLGTTNSLVSVVDSGFPIVLADSDGNRLQPSVVSIGSDETLVGAAAARSRLINSQSTIISIKRIIGRKFTDLTHAEITDLPFAIEPTSNGGILVVLGGDQKYTPVELSAFILAHLKKVAESALEESVERAVITVPAYFNHAQRSATREAAEKAGWQVDRILNEPTAAALAYGLEKQNEGSLIAVYDLGGGTFDLSILELTDGVFEVIATAGDTRLGGDDIDLQITEWLKEEIGLLDTELDFQQESRLLDEARKAKETLSASDSVSITLPFFHQNESYTAELNREQLEDLALPILEKSRSISQRAFLEAEQKGKGEIEHLILVGGSTRMPLVKQKLKEWFEIDPDVSQHPDESVAIGAGIQAGILCGRIKQMVLIDVVPLSLGIETFGGLMNILIARNTSIPTKAGELFTNGVSNQESMAVRVLQGERETAADNWLLGEIIVPFESGPKGSARVGVQFEIDENGMLTVLTRDTKTGEDQILQIQDAAVDVNDEAVEAMVSESIEHAFDDMTHRQVVECRMKSDELLPAVESALSIVGSSLDEGERQQIEAAAEEVKRLSEMESPPLADLKAANATLDQATQNLAAVLVEMAFEASIDDET